MARYVNRFSPIQRLFHMLLMLTFLVQSATGLARMYTTTLWGKTLGNLFGGYANCLEIHRFVGLLMIALFVLHLVYLMSVLAKETRHRDDSLLPQRLDLRLFVQHVGWFLGLKKEPRFGRWGYWEKFDYWAVFWGMTILGSTGLLLYSPVISTRSIPGWGLNITLWVHRIEAVLAMAHIFVIHFFVAHLRRRTFPMDQAIFHGKVKESHAQVERAEWMTRLLDEKSQRIEETPPAPAARWVAYVIGFTAVASGLYLLIGSLLNLTYVSL